MTIRRLTLIQVVVIVAMSCAAAYAFYMSFAYSHARDAISEIPGSMGIKAVLLVATLGIGILCAVFRNWLVAGSWAVVMLTLAELLPLYAGLGGFLVFVGVLLVVRQGWVWGFLGVLVAASFPSLMAFSSADWLWFVPDFDWQTELNSAAMAALFGLLVVGHLALRYATRFKHSGTDLLSQGFDIAHVETFWAAKLRFAGLVLAGASLIAAVIVGAAIGLDRLVGGHVGGSSFKPVLFGVGGSAILIAAVYYLLMGKRTT